MKMDFPRRKVVWILAAILVMCFSHMTVLASESSGESHWAQKETDFFWKTIESGEKTVSENLPWSSVNLPPDSSATREQIVWMMNCFFENCVSLTGTDEEITLGVTREEFGVLICQVMGAEIDMTSVSHFQDDTAIAPWARPYIALLEEQQIMIGYPGGIFLPQREITVAEVMTVIYRLTCMKEPNLEIIDNEISQIEVGQVEYVDGTIGIIPVEGKMVLGVQDSCILAISLPEGVEEEDLLWKVEDASIVEIEESTWELTALKPGSTQLLFQTKDKEYRTEIQVTVCEDTEEVINTVY